MLDISPTAAPDQRVSPPGSARVMRDRGRTGRGARPDPAPGSGGGWPREIALLAGRGLSAAVIRDAVAQGRAQGVAPGALLLADGHVSPAGYYAAVAEANGLPFLPDGSFLSRHAPEFPPPPGFNGPVPIGRGAAGEMLVAIAPPPGSLDQLVRHLDRFPELRARVRIATPEGLARAVAEADPGRRLALRRPAISAAETLSPAQRRVAAALIAAFLVGSLVPLKALVVVASILVTLVGLATSLVRLLAGIATSRSPLPAVRLAPEALPWASVLVPVYREARVAASLVAHLDMLDYPRDRLEILFLLEADDPETEAALRPHLGPAMRIVRVPDGGPRTKPRALAHGLTLARGDLVTVYDGEDRPDPDQLQLAASLFAALPRDVAVLQAHLAIDHGSLRFFPRQFLLEYSALFDALLPWMSARGWPIPLGGTSNHFRRAALEAVGGWDPHNVTEDADLAVRLARAGYRMSTLASTTWEEAPLTWRAWHRQRTRWLKGWLQTLLVLLRDPVALLRDLRRTQLPVLVLYLLGMVTTLAAHPVFLIVLIVYGTGLAEVPLTAIDFATVVLPLAGVSVVACYGSMSVLAIGGAAARGRLPSAVDLVLIPVYWLAQSVAFYAALVELVRRPHRWSKTEHGLASRPGRHAPRRAADLAGAVRVSRAADRSTGC